jgi:hypothetical protein
MSLTFTISLAEQLQGKQFASPVFCIKPVAEASKDLQTNGKCWPNGPFTRRFSCPVPGAGEKFPKRMQENLFETIRGGWTNVYVQRSQKNCEESIKFQLNG